MRRGKYANIPTEIDGIKFQSKLEATRYSYLSVLQKAGEISELQMQVPFKLEVNGILICKYIADFTYMKAGEYIVEDTKSPATITPEFRLKAKMMKAIHDIDILIVYAKPRKKRVSKKKAR